MGERKVQLRYYPPDFDPSVRLRNPHKMVQGRMEIRNMLPFSIQCSSCSNFMVRGTKFNSKVEHVVGEDYLGMKVHRIIGKCSQCNALFAYKTDLKNSDYTMERGATRNFELWRDTRDANAAAAADKEAAESYDPMKALENRTEESRRQIDALDALEQLRDLRAEQARLGLGPDALLARVAGGGVGVGGGGGGGGASAAAEGEEEGGWGGEEWGGFADGWASGGGGGGATAAAPAASEEEEDAREARAAFARAAAAGSKRPRPAEAEPPRRGGGGGEGDVGGGTGGTAAQPAPPPAREAPKAGKLPALQGARFAVRPVAPLPAAPEPAAVAPAPALASLVACYDSD
jgi:hypothetical protein